MLRICAVDLIFVSPIAFVIAYLSVRGLRPSRETATRSSLNGARCLRRGLLIGHWHPA